MSLAAPCPQTVRELPAPPGLDLAATLLLRQLTAGMPAPDIAQGLGVAAVTINGRISALARLKDDFTARGRAQLAAAALPTDSVDCAAADDRFPALPLSVFTAGYPAADRGRQP
ncbi:hypothetical protein [Streptomyces sp. CAU 1734]|uniref:hypothetical protein n=1 Tax=Streptomyces sp. CAU 1734 TaxID=3140360 RepID=UPI00326137DD